MGRHIRPRRWHTMLQTPVSPDGRATQKRQSAESPEESTAPVARTGPRSAREGQVSSSCQSVGRLALGWLAGLR